MLLRHALMILIISIGVAPGIVSAQVWGTLAGQVVTRLDRRPLSNVSVEVENVETGERNRSVTDELGRFTFHRLVPGHYRFSAAPAGFRPEQRIFRLAPRELLVLDILLEVEPVREAVTVEAPSGSPPQGSPSGTIVEGKRIAALPEPIQTHLPEIIAALVPGAVRSHDDLVHVRGSELALNAMLNGVFFWENPHALFSAGLDPGIIESVNVVTGPFSAEYGNRLGGVLDIVTKSGFGHHSGGAVTLSAGTTLRNHATVEYGGQWGRFGYYGRVMGWQSARFLSPPERDAHHDLGRGLRTFFQFDVQPSARDLLRFTLMGNGLNFEIPNTAEEERYGRDLRQHGREQTLIAVWDRVVSPRTTTHIAFYQRLSRTKLFPSFDPRSVWAQYSRRLDTLGVKADVAYVSSPHGMKMGVDVVSLRPRETLLLDPTNYDRYCTRYDLFCLEFFRTTWQAEKRGQQVSAYFQDRLRVRPWLMLDAGLRFDAYHLATRSNQWSPRVGLSLFIPKTEATLHLSYNRFFVPPPVEAILLSSAKPGDFVHDYARVPAHPVLPEMAHQFHAGISRTWAESLRVDITTFYRLGDLPVHPVQFPGLWIFPYVNFDRERVMGAELSVEIRRLERIGLSGFFNYSASRAYYYNPVRGGFTAVSHGEGRFLAPFDQTHTGTAGILYSPQRRGFWTGVWFEYGSGTPIHHAGEGHTHTHDGTAGASAPSPQRVPGHLVMNLSMGIDVLRRSRSKVSLQWAMENVTNNVYVVARESLFTPGQFALPRQASASVKVSF